jgi:DNA-binding transcriptional MerR regulator
MDLAPWTLQQLTAHIDAALRHAGIHQENGQVAEAPNARAIRWYQSTGLLRRPEQRGRVAFYGPIHLAEVVAIKRLQSQGFSLEDVQRRLVGLSDDAVVALADVDTNVASDGDSDSVAAGSVIDSARDFWTESVDADVDDAVDVAVVTGSDEDVVARATYDAAGVSLTLPAHIDRSVAQAILARVVRELSPLLAEATAPTAKNRSSQATTSSAPADEHQHDALSREKRGPVNPEEDR